MYVSDLRVILELNQFKKVISLLNLHFVKFQQHLT